MDRRVQRGTWAQRFQAKSATGVLRVEGFPLGRIRMWQRPNKNAAVDDRRKGTYGPSALKFSYRNTEATQMRSTVMELLQMYKIPCLTPAFYTDSHTPDFLGSLQHPFCMLSYHPQSHQHPGWRRVVRASMFPLYPSFIYIYIYMKSL